MELIRVTPDNLEREHICCAISSNKDPQVVAKKEWLAARMEEGLVFLKGDLRGKCFIEYLPAEAAWAPVEAPGYMYIDCLWVAGKFKGQGYSRQLLGECIRDSREKGKKGLVIVSSPKKMAYLADKKYLLHHGFCVADQAEPYFELLYLPFEEDVEVPEFRRQVKCREIKMKGQPEDNGGFVLYYTKQCPFTTKYVPLIEQCAEEHNLPFRSVLIDSREKAQSTLAPFTTYSLFYNGEFVTHEILSVKKFETIAQMMGGFITKI